jgi:hypothetical protein
MRKRTVFGVVGGVCLVVGVVPLTVSAQGANSGTSSTSSSTPREVFWRAEVTDSRFVTRTGEEFAEDDEEPTVLELTTTLSGQAEVSDDGTPGVGDPDGTGTATIEVLPSAAGPPTTLCWAIVVQNVVTPAIGAHIHEAPAGENGPVVVPLSAPNLNGTSNGCTTPVDEEVLGRLIDNPAGFYVNVHTTDFPAGAVRGQLEGGFGGMPGDQFFLTEDLFASDENGTKGDSIGRTIIQCTLGLAGSLQCAGTAFLDGRGQIHVSATVPFTEEAGVPFDVAVVGGTGEFATFGGDATITDHDADTSEAFSLYAMRLKDLAP